MKPQYWKRLDEPPSGSIEAYISKDGFVLYKVYLNPVSILSTWFLVKRSNAGDTPLGAKASVQRDIKLPPKKWANEMVRNLTKAPKLEPNEHSSYQDFNNTYK